MENVIINLSNVTNRTGVIEWIIREMRQDYNALGFLPHPRITAYSQIGWVRVCYNQNQLVGYCISGEHKDSCRIYQLWTVRDARRIGIGQSLTHDLEQCAIAKGYTSITCRVATDLESNIFWAALGYQQKELVHGGRARARMISVRVKDLLKNQAVLAVIAYAKSRGFDLGMCPTSNPGRVKEDRTVE